jgi:hypothetical protein
MITVFGHLDGTGTSPSSCVSVIFQGGPNGGSVTFTLCGGTKTSTFSLGANQNSFQICVENNSWVFSDFFMTAAIQGVCSSSDGGSSIGSGPPAAGFLEDAFTDEPISEYSTSVGNSFNLYMHSNVAWRLELSNSNLYNDGDTSGPPYTDAYDHELGAFDAISSGTTLINLVNDANGDVLDTVTVTISGGPSSGSGSGIGIE